MKSSAKNLCSIFIILIFITACAGRAANPVMIQQYGDHNKSCKALATETQFIQSEITRLMPETEKTGTNVALGVTGAFLLVPLFFMDFSESEQIEVNAYRQRYNNLVIIAEDKKCGMPVEQIPEFQVKQESEES